MNSWSDGSRSDILFWLAITYFSAIYANAINIWLFLQEEKMNKLLIAFGLVILFVTLPCASESDEEFDDTDDSEDGGGSEGGDEYVTKGEFVETDGKKKECSSHEACYDQREPQAWCRLSENQAWTDRGCFCEDKLHSCVIERTNGGKLEYSYCAPEAGWQCA
ncbi:unnamed protein product [Brugia pahangi]|uniref:Abundant larval transcript-2 (ALT2) protein n=1 Tax=Brugia pahangi TaxID=6280 RepID=A0A0N4TBS3_BRUPA|nr:unnamed protein product [Brugia pahangi]